MHLLTLRALTVCASMAVLACPSQAENSFPQTAVVTVAVVPEQVWQQELVPLRLKAAVLLERIKKLIRELKLPPSSEVICMLQDDKEASFSKGESRPFPEGWRPPAHDPIVLEPEMEMIRLVGTEVKIQPKVNLAEGKIQYLSLKLTHVFGEPTSHLINFGAAAKSEEERLKLSVPLPVFEELEWAGNVSVTDDKPRLVASLCRHTQPPKDANTKQRCLIFVQLIPESK